MTAAIPTLPTTLETQVTQLLTSIDRGGRGSSEELLPLVYEQLRKLARFRLASQSQAQTLQATALVHEAYVRLSKSDDGGWDGKAHFFAAAAESMRRIVIDNIRRKASQKHGGRYQKVELDEFKIDGVSSDDQLLAVNEALDRLRACNEEAAELVKLRFFAGLTLSEAAQAMEMAERTAKRRWAFARAWLYRELRRDGLSPA